MLNIKERLEGNDLLGYIKHEHWGSFYLMPIAYWVLNYRKYDPVYNPKDWTFVFRDNILNVTDDAILGFLSSIKQDRIPLEELKASISDILEEITLTFYVDFNHKLFVNAFEDIEVETYLPDESWRGKFDNPLLYLPAELKKIFKK